MKMSWKSYPKEQISNLGHDPKYNGLRIVVKITDKKHCANPGNCVCSVSS